MALRGAKEGAVVTEEDSSVEKILSCTMQVCVKDEEMAKPRLRGHELCWEHTEQADLTEDEG